MNELFILSLFNDAVSTSERRIEREEGDEG
jgi:hypothetical protein